jgi:hypothetical protein
MNEKTLKKDLNYLSDMLQESEKTKKKLSTLKNQEQLRFKLLKIYAYKLNEIKLKIAPQIMTRHRENLSFYHTKSKRIYWTIGMSFFVPSDILKAKAIDSEEYKFLIEPQEESQTMMEIIDKQNIGNSKILILMKEKTDTNQLLEAIKDSKASGFIRDEAPSKEKCVTQVDWWGTLADNIRGLNMIEYPIFMVVFKEDREAFEKEYKIVKREK